LKNSALKNDSEALSNDPSAKRRPSNSDNRSN